MKKSLKIIAIVFSILILVLLINSIRNIYIVKYLHKIYSQYISDIASYEIIVNENTMYTNSETSEQVTSQSSYTYDYTDDKLLIKTTINGEEPTTELIDKSDSKYINYLEEMTIDKLNENFNISYVKLYMFSFIKEDNKNYIICPLNSDKFYFSKENGTISKIVKNNDWVFQEYSVEKNT